MKCAIIKSSILVKYNRFDPEFYIGSTSIDNEIAITQKRLKDSKKLLKKRQNEKKFNEKRIKKIIKDKEIVLF